MKRKISILIGIPTAVCSIFIGLLCWGLAFGVDPLEQAVESRGVRASLATQRMGDQRLFVYMENVNQHEVAVDLNVSVGSDRARQFHVDLTPHSTRRIYSSNPNEKFGRIVSLLVN